MKREILFRGKSKSTGEWFYGNLFVEDAKGRTHVGITTKACFNIDHETVGQYTGVPDVNGKKIFEGDHDKDGNCVVFCERCNGWQFAQIDIQTKDVCIPCHCCDGNFMFNDIINQFEITGNIHDNKELLS